MKKNWTLLKQTIVLILLSSIVHCAYAQTEDLKSLEEKLTQAKGADERWQALVNISDYLEKNYNQQLLSYAKLMKQFADSTKNASQLFYAYRKMGEGSYLVTDYNMGIHYDTLAIAYAYKEGDGAHIFQALSEQGSHFARTNKFDKAIQSYSAALTHAKSIKNEGFVAEAHLGIGGSCTQSAKFRQSVYHLKYANTYFTKVNNKSKIHHSIGPLAWAYLELGKTDSAHFFLQQLMDDITKGEAEFDIELQTYAFMAKAHMLNGNYKKGFESYKKAQDLFKQFNMVQGYNLAFLDLASFQISLNDYKGAKKSLETAAEYFKKDKFYAGNILVDVVYADYYSHLGKNEMAMQRFNKAKRELPKAEYQDVEEEYLRTLYEHFYRAGEYRNGDSTLLQFASYVLSNKEPEAVAFKLKQFKDKNPNANPELLKVLDMIYSTNGQAQLKKLLTNKTFHEILPMNELLAVNPYSSGTAAFDSIMNIQYNKELLEMEAKYKTRAQQDSIINQQLELTNASQKIAQQKSFITTSILTALLLVALLVVIIRSRKKAVEDKEKIALLHEQAVDDKEKIALMYNEAMDDKEKIAVLHKQTLIDKGKIALLHDEVYHNVVNQLKYLQREVDKTEDTQEIALNDLQAKLTTMIELQKLIYLQIETGTIPLKKYFEEMCHKIAELYSPEKEVGIEIATEEVVPKDTATILGRLVCELFTNSLKHAFHQTPHPEMKLVLQNQDTENYLLHYNDNGVGLNETVSTNFGSDFILNTINTTLKGRFKTYSDRGAHMEIIYPKNYKDEK